MNEKASATRSAAGSSPTTGLSPIIQLLPTGYRDVQPFQRGQGWHSNGRATSKLRKPRDNAKRVIFPVIPTANGAFQTTATGPNASNVPEGYPDYAGADATHNQDDTHEREDSERRAMSPSASAIPVPPTVPRRPSSGSRPAGNQRVSSSGLRSRVLAASPRSIAEPSKPLASRLMETEDEPPPNAATMEKLWQEYAERTKHSTKTVDAQTYHRRMQHRYNETKALRERIAQLEIKLEDTQRERDDAREASLQLEHRVKVVNKGKDDEFALGLTLEPTAEEPSVNTSTRPENGFVSVVSRMSISHKLYPHQDQAAAISTEEKSYRERCFKLERTLATAKEGIAQLQSRLTAMHENDRETIDRLRAQLQLEQQASKLISAQLREIHTAFKSTADQLVTTQIALEKEKIEKQIVIEQIQAETKQLISDHKRKELQSRVKNVVRTLGKEALHQKMEALHTRILTAEHHMRAAQLEVTRLQRERDLQQQRLDEILASREIKYHVLAEKDGGVPGILNRATPLYHGTRTVDGQFLLVQMLYEDNRVASPSTSLPLSNQHEPPSDPEDGYCIHLLVYDAFTAQDDYLTFHLRDIHRLVPDADKYLAQFQDRKHERYLALAELLFAMCRIGFKNGHIVLTERPTLLSDDAAKERTEVPIYRGYRYLRAHGGKPAVKEVLVDLVVNEVCNPAMSQLWWLEVQAIAVDGGGDQSTLTIDSQLLKSIVPTFTSYRPSDCLASSSYGQVVDEHDVYGIHEELLHPLMERIEWHEAENIGGLIITDTHGEVLAALPAAVTELPAGVTTELPSETKVVEYSGDSEMVPIESSVAPPPVSVSQRVLDHRSIMRVDHKFFCVRIQEVWDGELMLRIVMEEPDDTMHRHEVTLHEQEIMAIAAYLHRKQLCDVDYSCAIKDGLPVALHDPLCRLLKRYIRPCEVVPLTADQAPSKHNAVVERICLTALMREVRHARSTLTEHATSSRIATLPTDMEITIGRGQYQQVRLVDDLQEELDDTIIGSLVGITTQLSQGQSYIIKERHGCRLIASPGYVAATAYAGFASPVIEDIVAITLWPVTRPRDPTERKPELIIARGSILKSLKSAGLRVALDQDMLWR